MNKLEGKERQHYWVISIGIIIVLLLFIFFLVKNNISEPTFSNESGFYDSDFELEIKTVNPNLSIFYTTDGTIPDRTSLQYTTPLKIYDYSINDNIYSARSDVAFKEGYFGYVFTPQDKVRKAMIVKAIAYNKYGKSSDVVTATYFIGGGMDNYRLYL